MQELRFGDTAFKHPLSTGSASSEGSQGKKANSWVTGIQLAKLTHKDLWRDC